MVDILSDRYVFVFGSNLAGRHGAGAAKYAHDNFDAEMGIGQYWTSYDSYAIPTKDENIQTLSLERIETYVRYFINDAWANSRRVFLVTAIGTGLAGYKHSDIAPMFTKAPANCVLPTEWYKFCNDRFWIRKNMVDQGFYDAPSRYEDYFSVAHILTLQAQGIIRLDTQTGQGWVMTDFGKAYISAVKDNE